MDRSREEEAQSDHPKTLEGATKKPGAGGSDGDDTYVMKKQNMQENH
jgi:hypothetical protein